MSEITSATHLGLCSSFLMTGSLISLLVISMLLFDCSVSVNSRGIICYNGPLIHCVLFVADTTVSKDIPRIRPSFPLISFLICRFFGQRRGKLISFTSTLSPMDTF